MQVRKNDLRVRRVTPITEGTRMTLWTTTLDANHRLTNKLHSLNHEWRGFICTNQSLWIPTSLSFEINHWEFLFDVISSTDGGIRIRMDWFSKTAQRLQHCIRSNMSEQLFEQGQQWEVSNTPMQGRNSRGKWGQIWKLQKEKRLQLKKPSTSCGFAPAQDQ